MTGILSWIILGGLAGWLGSMLMSNKTSYGVLGNIALGILGAFVGGLVFGALGGGAGDYWIQCL